jgi:hypothetical protein
MWVQESRRIVAWGIVLPAIALLATPLTGGLSMLLLVAYPLNVARIGLRLKREGQDRPWTLAFFLMLAKIPEAIGWLRFQWGRLTGSRSSSTREFRGTAPCAYGKMTVRSALAIWAASSWRM